MDFAKRSVITAKIPVLRDPFVLSENGTYYVYGTGWVCYRAVSGTLDGEWESLGQVAVIPEDCEKDCWAPEVHKIDGRYYMFTTYYSARWKHRGCTVLVSDAPEGPFVPHSDGIVTPRDRDAIDGTFYRDREGCPWMVYVGEWTATDDHIGRMMADRLSPDLKTLAGEPIELFRADDAPWANSFVTDGCFLHRTADGDLLMLWSNFASDGYCVGIAESESGEVTGPWKQAETPLFSKDFDGVYDGGHGMIFRDGTGGMCLALHSPNDAAMGRPETPVFLPLREENGTLVFDL